MTENMDLLYNFIRTVIEKKFPKELPTQDDIDFIADENRKKFSAFSVSDAEFEEIKKRLKENIVHSIGYAVTLRSRDSEHKSGWYHQNKNDGFFWGRYREYLLKKWNSKDVSRLNETTDNIMDDLGDPLSNDPFQRRGLLLGDVQSGKTATYTAICNKAADAGYKIIIVLAGLTENLRRQTQERLDTEFVGLDSKYTLDKKANSSMRNLPVGVGRCNSTSSERRITRFTSVTNDFKVSLIRSVGLNLKDLNGTALFVVKKHKSILNNLQNWLTKDLTKDEDVLNLPLLLIDDEADNASINTNSDEENPTAINKAIRKILRSFKQASYMGITATPFANIFITPEMEQDGAAKDLFPRHFLTLLPTPSNYIGAEKIFGVGDADADSGSREKGEYDSSLVAISNEEMADYFPYKHKKDLAESLNNLPPSLLEAVRYFALVTAISDARFDDKAHRSMMVNVSRFTNVQNKTAELLTDYVSQLRFALDGYSQLPVEQAEKITEIRDCRDVWDKYNLECVSKISWPQMLKDYLYKAVCKIKVKAVNQSTGAQSLNYYDFPNGMRVIAVGGNSLSRGLTLEGLCVSYFYRNTMMYDTLLQMGRWFGYRSNYEDLFKIWIGEDSIGWYSYITDAVEELKEELRIMEKQNMTPEEFGLKVRQAPGTLMITARNKMRTGKKIPVPITVSGRMLEAARLWNNKEILDENNCLCDKILKEISRSVKYEYDKNVNAYIWRNVPKSVVIDLVRKYKTHPWSLNFQPEALAAYIEKDDNDSGDLKIWDIAVPCGSAKEKYKLEIGGETLSFQCEARKINQDPSIEKMLQVNGRHLRIGSGACAKIGLSKDEIERRRESARESAKDPSKVTFTDRTYLDPPKRKPIALLHPIFNEAELSGIPSFIWGIGLGFPGGKEERTAEYVVNSIELQNYVDSEEFEDEDDYAE